MMQQQSAPGWYPNPSGAKGKLYWDGQQWTQGPPPKVTKQIDTKKVLIICGALIAVIAVLSLFQGGDDKETETASSSTSTTAPVFIPKPSSSAPVPVPAPAPVAPAASCIAADPDLIAQVEGQLGGGLTLLDNFQAIGPDGYVYVGGNIMEGEAKLSSSDVWIAQDGWVIFALSGTAREMTPQLADGRDLGLSAGDEVGAALQECINVAERARNAGN